MLDRVDLLDLYSRLPERAMRFLSYPLGRRLKTWDSHSFESARMLNDAFAFIVNERVPGDYFEFGVLRGRTFVEAWHASRRWKRDTRLHAFDSFEGLPGAEGPFSTGEFAAPRRAFERTLRLHRVPPTSVTVTEGFFDATLTSDRLAESAAAIVWVDCDIYESAVPVLRYLTDKLVEGTVLVFDDWYCHHARDDRGERRACREWLDANPQIELTPYRSFHWAGQSFVVSQAAA